MPAAVHAKLATSLGPYEYVGDSEFADPRAAAVDVVYRELGQVEAGTREFAVVQAEADPPIVTIVVPEGEPQASLIER